MRLPIFFQQRQRSFNKVSSPSTTSEGSGEMDFQKERRDGFEAVLQETA